MNENQKKVTEEYRQNWDEIFKKKEEEIPPEHTEEAWVKFAAQSEARYQADRKKRTGITSNWTGD